MPVVFPHCCFCRTNQHRIVVTTKTRETTLPYTTRRHLATPPDWWLASNPFANRQAPAKSNQTKSRSLLPAAPPYLRVGKEAEEAVLGRDGMLRNRDGGARLTSDDDDDDEQDEDRDGDGGGDEDGSGGGEVWAFGRRTAICWPHLISGPHGSLGANLVPLHAAKIRRGRKAGEAGWIRFWLCVAWWWGWDMRLLLLWVWVCHSTPRERNGMGWDGKEGRTRGGGGG